MPRISRENLAVTGPLHVLYLRYVQVLVSKQSAILFSGYGFTRSAIAGGFAARRYGSVQV